MWPTILLLLGCPPSVRPAADSDAPAAAADLDADGVPAADDCDDADASVHPGATETCDGRDADCDGTASPLREWYADVDGDGWGGGLGIAGGCEAPAGHVEAGGDCDDADAAISPDAWDRCYDGVDQDCDGSDSAVCRYPPYAHIEDVAVVFDGVYAGGEAGFSVAGVGDHDGDGLGDIAIGAPLEPGPDEHSGHIYLVSGTVTGRHELPSIAFGSLTGGSKTSFQSAIGWATAGVGDVTGDGAADLVDRAWLVPGPIVGDHLLEAVSIGRYEYNGSYSHATPGDLDGDGIDDVLVGHQGYRADIGTSEGAAYVYYSLPQHLDLGDDDADALLIGAPGDGAGYSVSGAGDTDGDGRPDVLVSAPGNDDVVYTGGVVYLVTQVPDGISNLPEASAARLRARFEGEWLGRRVASAGDVNADGYGDVILSSRGDDAYPYSSLPVAQWVCASVVYGPMSGDLDLEVDAAARYRAEEAADCRRVDVAGPGDMDGDGFDDVAIGASAALNSANRPTGAVYIDYGPTEGAIRLRDADVKLTSAEGYTATGKNLDRIGDVNGDGFFDLVVGASEAGPGGRAYIVLGGW